MDQRRLNLNDLVPLWERKLPHRVYEPVLDSITWRDVDISEPAGVENVGGQGRSLTQDVFSAQVIRQRGIKERL